MHIILTKHFPWQTTFLNAAKCNLQMFSNSGVCVEETLTHCDCRFEQYECFCLWSADGRVRPEIA